MQDGANELFNGTLGRRSQNIDRHVGNRIRERRIMLGLSQQELAELIGVTYQQAHKYEHGINRVAAGRLYLLSKVLNVTVEFFFQGLDEPQIETQPRQRMLLEMTRLFTSLRSRRRQEAVCELVRALAEREGELKVAQEWVPPEAEECEVVAA